VFLVKSILLDQNRTTAVRTDTVLTVIDVDNGFVAFDQISGQFGLIQIFGGIMESTEIETVTLEDDAASHNITDSNPIGSGVVTAILRENIGNILLVNDSHRLDADYVPAAPQMSDTERITALEEENRELKEALDLLLSGVTEEGDEADG